jgi:hypothetical protein
MLFLLLCLCSIVWSWVLWYLQLCQTFYKYICYSFLL